MGGVTVRKIWTGRCLPVAAVVALAAAVSGCSSSLSTPAPNLSSFFNSVTTTATGKPDAPAADDITCPDVSVRAGASTLSVSSNVSDDAALNLRYQVGIGQTARECKLVGNTVTMRVGVQGRVILGPAGGPGQIDVPVRLAVVHEGPNPKPILTKLNRVSVTIPTGDGNVQFTMIEDEISFPMPRAGVIDEYIVYVGFDALGLREPAKPRPQQRAPRRPPA